jgi:imidazolonepropionase-like amidohydrolase
MHDQISPQCVLEMATLDGACALGCESETGSLTPGKLANMLALRIPAGVQGSLEEILGETLTANERPNAVWLRGNERPPATFAG